MHIYIHTILYKHVCIHICIRVYIYIYTYVYTHFFGIVLELLGLCWSEEAALLLRAPLPCDPAATKCSRPPGSVLRKLIFPRVFFSGIVFFSHLYRVWLATMRSLRHNTHGHSLRQTSEALGLRQTAGRQRL